MDWRLNAMSLIARVVIMAALVVAGEVIVRNVTLALTAMVSACGMHVPIALAG